MNYAAEIDRIVGEYTAASRSVLHHFLEVDAHTTRGGAQLAENLREQLRPRENDPHPETPAEAAARAARAERKQLLRELAERQTRGHRPPAGRHGREEYVLPSDWTDEDEARAEGYGPPRSWLS